MVDRPGGLRDLCVLEQAIGPPLLRHDGAERARLFLHRSGVEQTLGCLRPPGEQRGHGVGAANAILVQPSAGLDVMLRLGNDGVEHRLGQPAGIRVVARHVVAIGQQHPARQGVEGAMFELEQGLPRTPIARNTAAWASSPSTRIDPQTWHYGQLCPSRNGLQFLISVGMGRFAGGTQRTALTMRQSCNCRPSAGSASIVPRGEVEPHMSVASDTAGYRRDRP